MYDNNSAPISENEIFPQSDLPVMQASSSSNQTTGYLNSSFQPGDHTDAQPHIALDHMSTYIPPPERVNRGSNYATNGQGQGRRPNSQLSSSLNTTTPQGRSQRGGNPQSSSSANQRFPCLAGTSGSLNCCCPSCMNISLLDPTPTLGPNSNTSNQVYGFGSGPASVVPSFQLSTPGFVESQTSTFGSHPSSSATSQYNPLLHSSSMQYAHDNPTANLSSSSTQFPSHFLDPDHSHSMGLPDMALYQRSFGTQAQATNSPHGFSHKAGDRIPISWPEFIKVQRYLDEESKDFTTPQRKEQIVAFIGISRSQLDFCIAARLKIYPHIKNAVSSSTKIGFPTDYALKWFQHIEPSKRGTNRAPRDSAYQSDINIVEDITQPTRKRRRAISGVHGQKPFQCTYIEANGTYCLVENGCFNDWKRHEETHWAQRKWECILLGTDGNVSCHICLRRIDLAGQNTISHGPCLDKVFRKGHHFHRKDKLIKHAQDLHGCAANVETWYTDINSDWKRQCGFCGATFTRWYERCAHVGDHFTSGSLRMLPDWKDPWLETDENGDQPPDEDDDDRGDDGNDNHDEDDDEDHGHNRRHKHSRNSDQRQFGNDKFSSRSGYKPGNEAGSRNSKRSRRSFDSSNGRSQQCQSDDMELGNSVNDIDCEKRSRQAEKSQSEVQSSEQTLRIAPTKSPNSQSAVEGFEFVRKLGYGTFGKVDEVFHPGTKTCFARKSIRTSLHRSLPALAQARREVVALCSLRHVHIIGVVAYYTLEDQFSIIMSPVAEENLSEYMLNESAAPLTKRSNLSKWMGCLTSAVSYMHEKSWQHLDIKPSNILVTGSHVMLSDFGGAMKISLPKTSQGSSCIVTPMYCAPELANGSPKAMLAGASDIFSLGCVFLEMVTIIYRQSLKTFQGLRSFEALDGSYRSSLKICWIWIQCLWDIDNALDLTAQHTLHVIISMLSDDPWKRPKARNIEKTYHYHDLCRSQQPRNIMEDETYLLVTAADTKDQFDPLNVAQRWLANCSSNHKNCSITTRSFFPSRILDVGIDSALIYLKSSNRFLCPYVALSHCWGAGNVLTTTTESLVAMSQGIAISSLSKTFSDAVRITRALGFQYLWIDSLCIIQDQIDDWISESSQMHKIYSHSSLTLCLATDGNAAADGKRFLSEKPEAKVANPKCLTCAKRHNEFDQLCDDTPTTMLLDSPWSKRGWTLQERILSPRVLYYSPTRMAWECGGSRSTFDMVSRMRENLKMLSIRKTAASIPKRVQDSPFIKHAQAFSRLWRDVVKEFSKRHLTFPQDKLPALAGVASRISLLSGQQYVAGLWDYNLMHSLLWCRDFATTPLPAPAQYRAPSWSWAAIDSPVTWSKAILDFVDHEDAKILGYNVVPEYKKSPFGSVAGGGYLAIRGSMQKVLIEKGQSHNVLDMETRIPFAFAQWDCLNPRLHGRLQVQLDDSAHELWCMNITTGSGLLLREDEMGVHDTFHRVGVFRILENRSGAAVRDETRRRDVRSIGIV
ncbi:hypothetical protein VTL71DRAFT_4155 [Oculimacula yallundae]|uniref:Protein kinase domain-containing protein n=1 Tax=Oculimacula yallundae TaxID=86028 RepID=A0ABR4C527_9HELO